METLLSPETLALLALGATLAGFVDTLAGGGGLITVPLLLLVGLPPLQTLATNKLQGSFGTFAASLAMLRHGQISLSAARPGFIAAFLGAALGAIAVRRLNPGALDVVIPIVLGAIALYFLFGPKAGDLAGDQPRAARLRAVPYRLVVLPAIGFYDGFFGPGAGSFYAAAGVGLRGEGLLAATAMAKALNFGSNLGALLLFLLAGKIVWLAGGVMICGQLIGASLGSMAMIKGGAKLLRPAIVAMCFLMIARYGWQKGWLAAWF